MVIIENHEYKDKHIKDFVDLNVQNQDQKNKEDQNKNKWNLISNKKKNKNKIPISGNQIMNNDYNEYDKKDDKEKYKEDDAFVLSLRKKYFAASYTSPDPSKLPIPKFINNNQGFSIILTNDVIK